MYMAPNETHPNWYYINASAYLQSHQVSRLSQPVEPPPAEGEGAEVLVDGVQELLGALQPERDVADVKVLHVVRGLHVVVDNSEKKLMLILEELQGDTSAR